MATLSLQTANRLSAIATYDTTTTGPPFQAGTMYLDSSATDLLQHYPCGDLWMEHTLIVGAEIRNTPAAAILKGRGVKITAKAWGMRIQRARKTFAAVNGLDDTALGNVICASVRSINLSAFWQIVGNTPAPAAVPPAIVPGASPGGKSGGRVTRLTTDDIFFARSSRLAVRKERPSESPIWWQHLIQQLGPNVKVRARRHGPEIWTVVVKQVQPSGHSITLSQQHTHNDIVDIVDRAGNWTAAIGDMWSNFLWLSGKVSAKDVHEARLDALLDSVQPLITRAVFPDFPGHPDDVSLGQLAHVWVISALVEGSFGHRARLWPTVQDAEGSLQCS